MNIYHYPCISSDINPYNELLISALNAQGYPAYSCNSIAYLYSQFVHRKIAAIHFHWLDRAGGNLNLSPSKLSWQIAIILLLLISRLTGIKTVWTVHNLHTHNSSNQDVLFYRFVSALVGSLISHSPSTISSIASTYKVCSQKIQFIPHGNYPQAFASSILSPVPSDTTRRLRILYFGNISPYKGLDLLSLAIQAISKQLGDRTPDVTIVGSLNRTKYPLLAMQLHQCSNLNIVSGFVDNDELNQYLQNADFVVLPFRSSFTSGSLIYALSAGKPVLIPHFDSLSYYLSPTYSFTFSPGNLPSLISSLFSICTVHSPTSLQLMGKAARQFAQGLSWNVIAQETALLY
jgi:glycosyltransferase involved in cell wall biosynthesis